MSSLAMTFRTIYQTIAESTIPCAHEGCNETEMNARQARVPDLINLYMGARGTDKDPSRPMTAKELMDDAYCGRHGLPGVLMFPILDTASLMDRWVRQNAKAMEQRPLKPVRRGPSETRTKQSSVVALLSQRVPQPEKPGPKRRTHKHEPKPPRPAEKNYGTYKQDGQQKQGKKGEDPKKNKKGKHAQ